MTSVAKVTPQSAPRDTEGLMKLGIFQLRLLLEGMGALSTDGEKMAFAKVSAPDKVAIAQERLAAWDKANGGGGGATNGAAHTNGAAPPPPMQMPAPPGMTSPEVQQVDPSQVADAAKAAAPAATSKRSPRTSESKSESADLGAEVVNLLNRITQQNDEANSTLAAGMKELSASVAVVAKANQGHADNYKAIYIALQSMNQAIAQTALQSKLAMALVLPLAEQVLGASRDDILRLTLGDVDSIGTFIQQATTPGKG